MDFGRKWLIILISLIVQVHSRPQTIETDAAPASESADKITLLPFYGGAKGQSLQIIEKPDGSVITNIITTPPQSEDPSSLNNINPTDLENPPLPTKFETGEFSENLKKIQSLALKIIKQQEILKETGKLNPSEEVIYKENLHTLSETAQKIAEIQESTSPIENREGISSWLENRKTTTSKTKTKKKQGEDQKKKEEDKNHKTQEEEKKKEEQKRKEENKIKKEKEENEKEETNQGENGEQEGDSETVGIDLPAEDASVAEAKPIGLAVAGTGGVAASKPIATAVVGPGGLAIARPVGTAIAGVDPEQALVPIHASEFVLGSKPKNGNSEKANDYLSRFISKFHQN